jgi:DegV family protein with EDD domain
MVKIVTDSSSDLSLEIAKGLDITVVPLVVNINEKGYRDRYDLSPVEFYDILAKENVMPTTSQVTPQAFYEVFQKLVDEGHEVLAVIFSAELSGTFQSAVIAQGMVKGGKVEVYDTKGASVGHALTVMEAARMAKEGQEMDAVLAKVKDMSARMEHIFVVDNLEMLKKGGRISATQAFLGGMLNVKPVLELQEGKIVPLDKVRGWKKALAKLINVMEERGQNLEEQVIGISHANYEEMANQLAELLKEKFGVKEIFISEIGPVIGAHTGPGTIALFFQG